MGGNSIVNVVWFSYVIFSGAVFSSTVINITMLEYPELSQKLMVGENLELEWKFNSSRMADKNLSISLYLYNFTDSSKVTIVKLLKSGKIVRSPTIPETTFQRLNYNLSWNCANILLKDTNFGDSAGYGIFFDSEFSDKTFETGTEVLIVDMLSNEKESSSMLKTWIGQQIQLSCSIILKVGADAPTFTWIDAAKNITITENISVTKTKSVLTLNPQDHNDFGSYFCRVKTVSTKIRYNITVTQIEYPAYPIGVSFSPSKRSLTWMAPIHDKDGSSISFVVQYHDQVTCEWVDVNETVNLFMDTSSMPIFLSGNVYQSCTVRVCSTNKKNLESRSCSKSRKLTPNYSHPPTVDITRDSTDSAILSWERQTEEHIPIIGYVIHMIKNTKDAVTGELRSIHLDYKKDKQMYIFRNLEKLVNIMFRVCIKNSLCLSEMSCSKEVVLSTVYPSEPKSIYINYNSTGMNFTWKQPRIKGKGPIKYIVQVRKLGHGRWTLLKETKNLYVWLKSTRLGDHIRVCAQNNAGSTNKSCSKSFDLNKETMYEMEVKNEGTIVYCNGNVYTLAMMMYASIISFLRQ